MIFYDAHNHLHDAACSRTPRTSTPRSHACRCGGAVVNGTEEGDWDAVAACARAHAWVRPAFGPAPVARSPPVPPIGSNG